MTTVDTAALRALADAGARSLAFTDPPTVRLDVVTLRALCDGYDEAQRLRVRTFADYAAERYRAERDAARQALADLAADLRALCDQSIYADTILAGLVRAVIDRHAPATPTTEETR